MKIKKFVLLVTLLLLPLALVSCRQNKDLIQVGILQYLEHDALSDARKGFIDGLASEGFVDGENININLQNPETEESVMAQQASELVRKSDLILGIATPAASALVSEAKEQNKDTPILFTAVTDPVAAKLIDSNEKPGANVTGTNDMNPISQQIALALQLLPKAKKIGILYSTDEENSEIQAELAEIEAKSLGLEVVRGPIDDFNYFQLTANNLAKEVDIIFTPTDNKIADSIGVLNDVSTNNKVPVIVGEDTLVPKLPSLTIGINYYRLGLETAKMAVKILKDDVAPKDIPSIGLIDLELVINEKLLNLIDIIVSEELINSADRVIK